MTIKINDLIGITYNRLKNILDYYRFECIDIDSNYTALHSVKITDDYIGIESDISGCILIKDKKWNITLFALDINDFSTIELS